MKRVFAFGALALALSGAALAATHEVNVTRQGKNVYRINGKNALIQTRHCFAYARIEDAILRTDGYGTAELIFPQSKDKCDVKAVFGKSDQSPGTFKVHISHEADDWYEVQETGGYLKTFMCLELSYSEQAVLVVNAGGMGQLTFSGGRSCQVEAFYSKVRIN